MQYGVLTQYAQEYTVSVQFLFNPFTNIDDVLAQVNLNVRSAEDDSPEGHRGRNTNLFSKYLLLIQILIYSPFFSMGVKPFVCEHPGCGKRFKQKRNMRTHFAKVHGGN